MFRKYQGAKKRKLKSCQRMLLFAILSIVPPTFTTELENEKHSNGKPVGEFKPVKYCAVGLASLK